MKYKLAELNLIFFSLNMLLIGTRNQCKFLSILKLRNFPFFENFRKTDSRKILMFLTLLCAHNLHSVVKREIISHPIFVSWNQLYMIKFLDAGIQDVSTSISIVDDLIERCPGDGDESNKHLEARDCRYSCLISCCFHGIFV